MSEGAVELGGGGEATTTPESTESGSVETTTTPNTLETIIGSLPEELRGDPVWKNVKSVEELGKQFVNAQHLIGKKGILPPDPNNPDDINRYFSELGRPESPDAYNVGEFAPPEGVPWNPERQTGFLSKAHELGLNDAQVQGLLAWEGESAASAYGQLGEAAEQVAQQAVAQLKKDWGTQFDAKLNMANRAVQHFLGDEADTFLQTMTGEGGTIGANMTFIRMMEKISGLIGEDGLASDVTQTAHGQLTPEQAASELRQLDADKAHMDAFFNPSDPGHEEALARRRRLMAFAHPEPS